MSVGENHTGLRIDRPPANSVQCLLIRQDGEAFLRTTTWITEKVARLGLKVTISGAVWSVAAVYPNSATMSRGAGK